MFNENLFLPTTSDVRTLCVRLMHTTVPSLMQVEITILDRDLMILWRLTPGVQDMVLLLTVPAVDRRSPGVHAVIPLMTVPVVDR